MAITKTKADLDFLKQVDELYRAGEIQDRIAERVGLTGSGSLQGAVSRQGFRFDRKGGLKLVDILTGRPLADWIESGELVAESDESPAPVAA